MGAVRREVRVGLGARSYPVVLEPGGFEGLGVALARRLGPRPAVLVTDEVVAPFWADPVTAVLKGAGFLPRRVVLPAGEATKTLATWQSCVDAMLEAGVDRGTPVLALGGGVVGDVAGFAAASVLRGLPFVQLPTTLLAMVDSSVGGKTGVNHPRGKNLVGAFHQPVHVHAALATLATLPPVEVRAGLGEVVKTALLGDAALLERLEADAAALRAGEPEALLPVVARCVEIKAAVVAEDEREAGRRAVLNLGHTIGHGLETACGYQGLRHGEAVGIGLVLETAWAVRAGHCEDPSLPGRLARLLEALALPTRPPPVSQDAVLAAIRVDKKAREGKLRMPVAVRAGRAALTDLPLDALTDLLPELA